MNKNKVIKSFFAILLLSFLMISSFASAELIVNKYSNDFTIQSTVVDRAKACSCETIVDPILIENTGNFESDFKLEVLADQSWFTISEDEFTLAPSERKTVMIYSEIPCDSLGPQVFEVKATNSYGREKKIIQNLDVVKCQNSYMDITASKRVINLGEPVSYNIQVTNVGEFTEEYKLDFGSFNEYMTLTGEQLNADASFFLYPGQVKEINALLEVPQSFYGDFEIPFKIYSEKNDLEEEKVLKLTIENQYDHNISIPNNISVCSIIEDEAVFQVNNLINFENDFEVKTKGVSFVDYEPKSLKLQGDESENITLKIKPGKKDLGNHELKIIVDSKYGDISKEATVNINVRDCFNYEAGFPVKVKEETKLLNKFEDTTCCGSKDYYLTINNKGETKEAYDIIVDGPSWFSSETSTVNLKPNEEVTIKFNAELPCTDENYKIPVEVVLKKHPEIKTTAYFNINSQTQRTCHLISVDEQKIVLTKDTKIVPIIIEGKGVEGGTYELSVKSKLYSDTLEPSVKVMPGERKIVHLLTSDLSNYFAGKYKGKMNLSLELTSQGGDNVVYNKQFVSKLKNKGFFQKLWEAVVGYDSNKANPCLVSALILLIVLILSLVFLGMVISNKAKWFSKNLFTENAALIAKVVLGLLFLLVIISMVLAPSPSKASLYQKPSNTNNSLTFQWYENENYAINLADYFVDPDQDSLSYSSSTPQNIEVEIVDSVAILKPEMNFAGSEEIVFTAMDDDGGVTDSPVFTLVVLQKKELTSIDWITRYCKFINYALLALLLIIAFALVSLSKPKKEKIEKLLTPVPPMKKTAKKKVKATSKTASKATSKRSAHSLAVDRALVSMDEHEVKSILKTKGKRATKSNIAIVQKAIRDFKASNVKVKNREGFYQYMKDKRINQRLRNKK